MDPGERTGLEKLTDAARHNLDDLGLLEIAPLDSFFGSFDALGPNINLALRNLNRLRHNGRSLCFAADDDPVRGGPFGRWALLAIADIGRALRLRLWNAAYSLDSNHVPYSRSLKTILRPSALSVCIGSGPRKL